MPEKTKSTDVLFMWEEFANFIGVTPAIAMEWRDRYGLPVATIGNRAISTRPLILSWIEKMAIVTKQNS